MTTFRRRAVTISQVAAAAGVSYQTVSRVINDHPSVSPVTRQRIQKIIGELGYRPNVSARSLVTNRSHRVGIITLGARYYGPAQTITSIETALRKDGYTPSFATLSAPTLENLGDLIKQLNQQAVDGLILITPLVGVPVATILKLCDGVPFVLVDVEAAPNIFSVEIDQAHGARLATEHLLALGHTRIAEISGPLYWWDARQRHDSYLNVLRERGLSSAGSIEGTWEAESGYHAVKTLLAQGSRFTAIVAGNDQMALGALRGLRESGFGVPQDVSVIGFDDTPEAAFYEPPLSSVRQDFAALGQWCADLIVKLMRGESSPERQVVSPDLICRESTAPPT